MQLSATKCWAELCILYDKVLKIENVIANPVSSKKKSTYDVYVPLNVVPGIPVNLIIDNCNFKNDTPDGKNEFRAISASYHPKVS